MAIKLGTMLTYLERLSNRKSFDQKVISHFDQMVLPNHVRNKGNHIFTTRVHIGITLGRMITYIGDLLLIKSHDPFIT